MVIGKKAETDPEENVPAPTDDEHETILDTASEEDNQDDSCVVVNADEEWLKEYERMSEDITWSGEEDISITEPSDGCPMEEKETTIDGVVIAHDGDMIHWPCQFVVAEADQIMAEKQKPDQHGPADEIDGNSPADNKEAANALDTVNLDLRADETDENTSSSEMDDDKGHVDEPSTMLSAATKEGSDIPTGTVHPEVEAVCETVMTRKVEYPSNIEEQMPALNNSSYDSELESS